MSIAALNSAVIVVVAILVLGVFLAVGGIVLGRRRPGPPPATPPTPPPPAPPRAETAPPAAIEAPPAPTEAPPAPAPEALAPPRWRDRLSRARGGFGQAITQVFRKPVLSEEDWEDVEALLLQADVGVEPTRTIIADLREASGKTTTPEEIVASLRRELLAILGSADRSLAHNDGGLTIWLVTGVNGTGKTTTIGKLASKLAAEGKRVVLAAADTFRAAADQQLESWANRSGAEIVKHAPGADPAAVAFDGVRAAKARGADVLIVDTAGRLHTKRNLMDELAKIRRVLEREAGEPNEVLLVLDATTGQNGIAQARAFTDAAGVTGIALTKLDGTAKGGIVIACQQELGLPVKLVGLGEGLSDLAAFDPEQFVDALIG